MLGKNLRLDVKVVGDSGALASALVTVNLDCSSGQTWAFSGVTDSSGLCSFTVSKAPAGSYTATVSGLTAGGYIWDTERGVTSASYTVNGSSATGKPVKR